MAKKKVVYQVVDRESCIDTTINPWSEAANLKRAEEAKKRVLKLFECKPADLVIRRVTVEVVG
jgi:hypothetical protein